MSPSAANKPQPAQPVFCDNPRSLLAHLRHRLLPVEPKGRPLHSDFDLNPSIRGVPTGDLTPAAVLIPIVMRHEPRVLLTKRSADLPHHPGQVSFPGGRSDPGDASRTATALRELEEETGIAPSFVTVAGYLEPYETITGFAVQPVVGLVAEGFTLAPQVREVERIFEVPLALLLDPASLREEKREFQGQTRFVYGFRYNGDYIWGATAAILVALRERLS